MNWHKRLTQAREEKGIKKSAFAKLVGVSPPTVTDWENGETKMIEGANLVKVCSALGISPEWLLDGVTSITDLVPDSMRVVLADGLQKNYYDIPLVTLRLQAGITGFQTDVDSSEGSSIPIPKFWADRRAYNPNRLLAIKVKGQSMEPTLFEDDIVFINLDDKAPADNAVFAVNYDGEAVVKRMSRDAGQWWLMSDNSDQRKYYRRACRGAECIVIGRIVRRESENF
ncbi:LexA family transcriptional regulator [Janthinobacterium sp. UMAB-56]|uniref:LexA family transcriptional regulator n=1 Tax=Janthinobacterium sp. UMAB-56 TaxID=1365361 RepID=UPI00214C9AAF|nr:LexA family transcriptional regulator [Janthinobacterium sp. UMAB-56]